MRIISGPSCAVSEVRIRRSQARETRKEGSLLVRTTTPRTCRVQTDPGCCDGKCRSSRNRPEKRRLPALPMPAKPQRTSPHPPGGPSLLIFRIPGLRVPGQEFLQRRSKHSAQARPGVQNCRYTTCEPLFFQNQAVEATLHSPEQLLYERPDASESLFSPWKGGDETSSHRRELPILSPNFIPKQRSKISPLPADCIAHRLSPR